MRRGRRCACVDARRQRVVDTRRNEKPDKCACGWKVAMLHVENSSPDDDNILRRKRSRQGGNNNSGPLTEWLESGKIANNFQEEEPATGRNNQCCLWQTIQGRQCQRYLCRMPTKSTLEELRKTDQRLLPKARSSPDLEADTHSRQKPIHAFIAGETPRQTIMLS
ncbi:hypothetical protein LSTR_LSTR008515 [Laodelphax striatellus]|uniref:Uncharacterized protein n=1 Tax=Laodelphax striatellus TaxID=195883 RepID=A0A482WQR9_LAOST|nr:hypothetical protein LSTR_LSTR008515 [Laodelphax striatellus]